MQLCQSDRDAREMRILAVEDDAKMLARRTPYKFECVINSNADTTVLALPCLARVGRLPRQAGLLFRRRDLYLAGSAAGGAAAGGVMSTPRWHV
jgi:hypothetical protein